MDDGETLTHRQIPAGVESRVFLLVQLGLEWMQVRE
jgi:hypothetical protein